MKQCHNDYFNLNYTILLYIFGTNGIKYKSTVANHRYVIDKDNIINFLEYYKLQYYVVIKTPTTGKWRPMVRYKIFAVEKNYVYKNIYY